MPFIRGRYHINPMAGEALEAARAAEAALSELEQSAQDDIAGASDSGAQSAADDEDDSAFGGIGAGHSDTGPIHRVEIEAAEVVPSHSGRAQRGFVAHVHREVATSSDRLPARSRLSPSRPGELPSRAYAPRPETHAFTDHRDLVSFLRDEFSKDCGK
jgi:hypothetical protein